MVSVQALTHVWAQCGGKLQREFEGAAYDVFARTLRGLAATKLTKPGTFRCTDGDGEGHALRCSFKVRTLICVLSVKLRGVPFTFVSVKLGVRSVAVKPHQACKQRRQTYGSNPM